MKPLRPHTLLFDLDNTLINRNRAMRNVMHHWLMHHPATTYTLDDIMQQDAFGYADRTRFCEWLLETFGAGSLPYTTPATLLSYIQQQLVSNIYPEPEITALLAGLHSTYRLILASNGSSAVQRGKLKQSGLEPFFAPGDIFISGEMEYEKPAPEFFRTILSKLSLSPENTMMTGDDFDKDVQAPQQCGLLTCWVSHGRQAPAGIKPDITIHHITELKQWLKH